MSLTTRIVLLVLLALVPALAIQGYNEYALRASRYEAVQADALGDGARAGRKPAATRRQRPSGPRPDRRGPRRPGARPPSPAPPTSSARSRGCPTWSPCPWRKPTGRSSATAWAPRPAPTRMRLGPTRSGRWPRGGFRGGRVHPRRRDGARPRCISPSPLRARDGTIVGVLNAGVDLEWLSRYLQSSLRLPSTAATLIDNDGVILMRHPDDAKWVGQPPPAR